MGGLRSVAGPAITKGLNCPERVRPAAGVPFEFPRDYRSTHDGPITRECLKLIGTPITQIDEIVWRHRPSASSAFPEHLHRQSAATISWPARLRYPKHPRSR